ncbi:MAG TPA: hypothetical protein VK674_00005 [Candidatus Limnocylindria bacterium]|nr:hypothetical protein [Candidatus Limnocylindria bacterium]
MARSCDLSFSPEIVEGAEYPGFAYPATVRESIEAGVPVVLQATVVQGYREYDFSGGIHRGYQGLPPPVEKLGVWLGARNDLDTHSHTISTLTTIVDDDYALALARKASVTELVWQAPDLQDALNPPPAEAKTTFSNRAFTPIQINLGAARTVQASKGALGWHDIPDRQIGLSNGGEKMLLGKLYLNDQIAEASATTPVAKIRQDNWLGGYSYEGDGTIHRVKPLIMAGTLLALASDIFMPGSFEDTKGSTAEFPILRRIPVEDYRIGLDLLDTGMLLPDVDQDEEIFACINGMCLTAGRYAIDCFMRAQYNKICSLSLEMGWRHYEEWSAREWAKFHASAPIPSHTDVANP